MLEAAAASPPEGARDRGPRRRTTRSCIDPTGRRARLRRPCQGGRQPGRSGSGDLTPQDTQLSFDTSARDKLKLVDAPDIVTGKAQYGMDTRLDGMLYAVVARPPVYGGKLVRYDATEALKVPGVVRVVEIESSSPPPMFNPLGGVAVIGRNTWAAIQGRRALKIEVGGRPERQLRFDDFQGDARGGPPASPARSFATMATSTRRWLQRRARLDAEYYVPHLTHAAMEPPAATVRIVGGKCEVWGCFQSPQATRDMVAKRLDMSAGRRDRTGHLAGRWVRKEIQARFRRGGSRSLQGRGR